jgi:hypothetical protein
MTKNIKKFKNYKTAFSMVEISIVILIIGLLIAGISKASDMIVDSKVKSARSQTKASPVNRLPNLALWIETTSSESWPDRERGGPTTTKTYNLKDINPQLTANDLFIFPAVSIAYKEDGYNSLPSFNLSSDAKSTNSKSYTRVFDMEKGGGYTIFAVVKPVASKKIIGFDVSSPGGTDGKGLTLEYAADTKAKITSPTGVAAETSISAGAIGGIPNNVIEVITATSNIASTVIFSNGTASKPATPTPQLVSDYVGFFTVYSGVEIFEIIVVGEWLSDPLRQRVEQYLFKKWNIPNDKLFAGTF